MDIAFSLTGRHAEWLMDLFAMTQCCAGPRFSGPSELVRSLVEDLLDDDARDNAAAGRSGYGDVLH